MEQAVHNTLHIEQGAQFTLDMEQAAQNTLHIE
jgi:hypothetical protein